MEQNYLPDDHQDLSSVHEDAVFTETDHDFPIPPSLEAQKL